MLLVYSIYLSLSAVVVFLTYYSSLGRSIKAIALTALVLLGIFTQEHYISQLGKPINGFPPGEFVYIHHTTEGDDITLWSSDDDSGHRLYTFPYSQEVVEELEKAKAKTEGGQAQAGSFSTPEGDGEAPGLVLDDWEGPRPERIK